MANTTNFNWETPDDTDLVKDGALAIRTLGNAIDTSLVDLKGGTTGQVLSKTSNTDMDFTWVTSDDASAIQNAIVDAKGDLIAASAADTPARLAVGNNGESLVADSSATTGLRWQGNYAAGKNVVINGDFRINQRSWSSNTADATFGFDRFRNDNNGGATFSKETFTAGAAPVAGYEAINYLRCVTTGQSGAGVYTSTQTRLEDVRLFAGQTVTISFWAKAASGTPKIAVEVRQNFGTGGSPSANVHTYFGQVTLSTSWARYSLTAAIPSISGKTLGTDNNSYFMPQLWFSAGTDFNARTGSLGIQSNTFDTWGVQVEAGNVATAFQTATGTLAGELAACQRYFFRVDSSANVYAAFTNGHFNTTTNFRSVLLYPMTMRVTPTFSFSNQNLFAGNGAAYYGASAGTPATSSATKNAVVIDVTVVAATAGQGGMLIANNSTSAFIEGTAEL
jgi:hypothetical protein